MDLHPYQQDLRGRGDAWYLQPGEPIVEIPPLDLGDLAALVVS